MFPHFNRPQGPFHEQDHNRRGPNRPPLEPNWLFGPKLFQPRSLPIEHTPHKRHPINRYQPPNESRQSRSSQHKKQPTHINIPEYLNKFTNGLQKLSFGISMYQEYKKLNQQNENQSDQLDE